MCALSIHPCLGYINCSVATRTHQASYVATTSVISNGKNRQGNITYIPRHGTLIYVIGGLQNFLSDSLSL